MAITGARFLELNGTDDFQVSGHALSRLRTRAGAALSHEDARALFLQARQVRVPELFLLGYRPAYGGYLRRGRKSWYFRAPLRGRELIAVVSQDYDGRFVWVTTYARDAQTDLLYGGLGRDRLEVA